ncbi:MAG TPA: cytochrome c oxidase subunit II [Marine Group III euryarchaeote]|jgi:cytochrome c oxidase subunit 2|uniref:cytochrome-c oxidase n=1 Tax=Marine Group III euryarchaeote TaxID=2173149 RepID=A0A7J4GQF9_9ARCH|nr:cytochrome c oxidase subunit II [Marine Group III euryarchaeote]
MSLIEDLIFFDNPSLWNDFGGTSSGLGGIVWQMFIWSVIVGLLVIIWLAYNLVYYRHNDGDPDPKDVLKLGVFPKERGNTMIELAWTIAPLLLVTWLTIISLAPLNYLWDVPDENETDLTVEVIASQWQWKFVMPSNYTMPAEFTKCGSFDQDRNQQQNEQVTYNCLEIPHNSIVRFNINSLDVLHAFYIVEIGIKQDVVPNLQTLAWLDTSTVTPGEYNIYCAEMCGKSHSVMLAKLYITEVA